jgi:hypothetical protein
VQFDLSKYKFVEEMQIAAGLDSRPDLSSRRTAKIGDRGDDIQPASKPQIGEGLGIGMMEPRICLWKV